MSCSVNRRESAWRVHGKRARWRRSSVPDYNVEVELVDGHRMTVLVEDKQDSFFAAIAAGDHIVKRARAKLIAPACPLCWNSGIEREGHQGRVGPERRMVCRCEHGRELLAMHDARKYTSDPTKANAEPEAEVQPRTDGLRGWEEVPDHA